MFESLRQRLGSSSGVATTGAAFVLAVGSVAALGVGFDKTVLDMVDGGAWLANDGRGSVTHVNGDSGEADAAVKFLGLDGHELQVIEGPDGTYVLDLTTGQLYRIDTANLGDATGQTGVGSGVDVVVGTDVAYVVEMGAGKVSPKDPFTLDATGDAIQLGAPVTRGVIDSADRLWVAVPSRGDAVAITGGSVERTVEVAPDGNDLEISVVGGDAVVVNRTTAQVIPAAGGDPVDLPVRRGAPLRVSRKSPDATVRAVDPDDGVLVETDMASRQSTTTDLGRKHSDLGEPESTGGQTYVPDRTRGDVVVAKDGHVEDQFGVTEAGPGPIQTQQSGPNVYFNDPKSRHSVAVDRHGQRHEVDKYRPDIATNERPTDPSTDQPRPQSPPPRPKPPGQPKTPGPQPPAPPKPGAPFAPTITQTTPGDTMATVTWNPGADGGSPITSYRVRAQPGGREVPVDGTSRQATVEGLKNGTTYTLTIWATNKVGDSPPAQSKSVMPQEGTPDQLKGVSIDQADRSSGTINVEWGEPKARGGEIMGYDVVTVLDGKSGKPKTVVGTRTEVSGIEPGSVAYVTVAVRFHRAGSSSVELAQPVKSNELTVGGAPTLNDVRLTSSGRGTLSFAIDYDDGSPPAACTIRWSDARTEPGCKSSVSRTDLAYGIDYSLTVSMTNPFGSVEKQGHGHTDPLVPIVVTVHNTCVDGACGQIIRDRPAYTSANIGNVRNDGDTFNVLCQVSGESVDSPSQGRSSDRWNKRVEGGWVAAIYNQIDEIPDCR